MMRSVLTHVNLRAVAEGEYYVALFLTEKGEISLLFVHNSPSYSTFELLLDPVGLKNLAVNLLSAAIEAENKLIKERTREEAL